MYHLILVPLDGSKRAEGIFPNVIELAKALESRVVLLNIIEYSAAEERKWTPGRGDVDDPLRVATEAAEKYLTECMQPFEEAGVKVRYRVEYGPVVDTIINTARNENANLIAIASHGRTGLPQLFYGSVAVGVLHRVDRPLLVIRADRDK